MKHFQVVHFDVYINGKTAYGIQSVILFNKLPNSVQAEHMHLALK